MECDSSERTPEVDLLPHVCTRAHMNMHTPIHTQRGVNTRRAVRIRLGD